jgi:hypothetical protein
MLKAYENKRKAKDKILQKKKLNIWIDLQEESTWSCLEFRMRKKSQYKEW